MMMMMKHLATIIKRMIMHLTATMSVRTTMMMRAQAPCCLRWMMMMTMRMAIVGERMATEENVWVLGNKRMYAQQPRNAAAGRERPSHEHVLGHRSKARPADVPSRLLAANVTCRRTSLCTRAVV